MNGPVDPVSTHELEQLKESESRFLATFDHAPVGLAHVSLAGMILRANRALCQMLGFAADELAGRRVAALTEAPELAYELDAMLRLIAGETDSYRIEKRLHRKDGPPLWVEVSGSLVRDGAGAPFFVLAVVQDVSARRIAELRLGNRDREFTAILDLLPDVVAQFDRAGRHVYVNAAVERITGRRARDFIGRTNRELGMPPALCAHWDHAIAAVFSDGAPRTVAFEYEGDAGVRRFDGQLVALRESGGEDVTSVLALTRDVTSLVGTERERLQAALDASGTGTFRWNMRTGALEWDENLNRLFGLTSGETARVTDDFVRRVHPDDRDRINAALRRCIATGGTFAEEFRVVWADGTIRWLYDRGQTVYGPDGAPAYMTGACVDITERRIQQEQLRVMAETMPQIVWTTDPAGYHDYFNERWYVYTGMPRPHEPGGELETPQGSNWKAYLHPDDHARSVQRWQHSLDTGEPYEIEYRFREAATGKYRWFIGRALPLRDTSGRIVRWFGTCTDIEAQVQANALAHHLQRAVSRLARAGTTTEAVEVVASVGREALGADDAAVAVLAAGADTLIMVTHTSDDAADPASWQQIPLASDVPVAQAARTAQYIEAIMPEAVRGQADAPRAAAAMEADRLGATVAHPIARAGMVTGAATFSFRAAEYLTTEQRGFLEQLCRHAGEALERIRLVEAEREAQRRTTRLLTISSGLAAASTVEDVAGVAIELGVEALGAASAGLYLVDADGSQRLVASRGFDERVTAHYGTIPAGAPVPTTVVVRTGGAVVLESPTRMWLEYPDAADVWEAMGTGALVVLPLTRAGTGGRVVIGALGYAFRQPRELAGDELSYLNAIAQQTSQALERAQLLHLERDARGRAEQANRAKSEFLATMSHELRTPLNAIAGYADLMTAGVPVPVPAEHAMYLERIRAAQRHLLSLINSVLNFAKLEAGHVEFRSERVPVGELLDAVEPMIQPQMLQKALRLERVADDPAAVIEGDREKIIQILLNLASNAIKFTAAGGAIAVRATSDTEAIAIHVTDTGIGIPEDRLSTIFDPFIQVDAELTREHHGTGLGLAISRELARAMGGDLTVSSVLGHGSTFVLSLPRIP